RSVGAPLLDLTRPAGTSGHTQRRSLDLLETLNRQHLASRSRESELTARILSYELAYRMQTSAAEVVDIESEDKKTREMYGLNNAITDDYERKCLITERPSEEGGRVVEHDSGGGPQQDVGTC